MPMRIYTAGAMQRLRDAFDLKGKHDLLLDDVIVPVAIVENIASQASDQRNDATAFVVGNATAAVTGSCELHNNGNSGVDLLIDRMWVRLGLTGNFQVKMTDLAVGALLLGTADKQWNDTGQPGTPAGTPDHRDGGAYAAALILYQQFWTSSDGPVMLEPRLVVSPGFKVVLINLAVNEQVECTFQYRVRNRN